MATSEADPRKKFFDRIAPSWDALGEDYTQTACFRRWLARVGCLAGRSVLEIGCGTGTVLPWLCDAVGSTGRVVALDLSDEMLSQARARCAGHSPHFCQGEARRLPFADAGFDAVFVINTFPHLTPREQVLEELRRILRPGGCLSITHFCGRAFIHALHREVAEEVRNDILPSASELGGILRRFGFELQRCREDENFYDIGARKSSCRRTGTAR